MAAVICIFLTVESGSCTGAAQTAAEIIATPDLDLSAQARVQWQPAPLHNTAGESKREKGGAHSRVNHKAVVMVSVVAFSTQASLGSRAECIPQSQRFLSAVQIAPPRLPSSQERLSGNQEDSRTERRGITGTA
ncbi:UNVERIFIED_CONTAM: hypothetical protein FKN15_042458 [Acipenser sinensis]